MASPTKVLFIGLDAADKDLIQQWIDEGLLPTLKSFQEKGAWGTTENPPGLYVGAVWPSFFTGVSPARHARYCFRQFRPGSYEIERFRPSQVKEEPFWNRLSQMGKKVAIIDVPKTIPSKDLNGIMVVDWGSHDGDKRGLCTWPPSLASELAEKFGTDNTTNCDAFRVSYDEITQFRDGLIRRIAKKMEISSHFLKQGDWDLFLTIFSEAHCVGHQCWYLHDPNHPLHDPELARAVGDPIKDVYIAIDKAIANILNKVEADTHVIVLASHGMGPHYDGTFLLDKILNSLENPTENNSNSRKALSSIPGHFGNQVNQFVHSILTELNYPHVRKKYPRTVVTIKWLRDQFPPGVGLRKFIQKKINLMAREKQLTEIEKLRKRKYFKIPNNDVYGGIRINLAGREPDGVIGPGTEFEEICQSLTQDLLAFINIKTGEPLVRKVLRTIDLYQGKNVDHLPDLMVEWNRSAPVSSVFSPKTGEIHGEYLKCRTGDHKSEGLFFALGKSFKPGPIDRSVSIMDFAPTIASLLEAEICGLEGHSIASL